MLKERSLSIKSKVNSKLTISKCGGANLLLKNNKKINNRIIKTENNSNF